MSEEQFSRISLGGDALLRMLLELDAFRICPPLEADAFVVWCKKCGLDLTTELLEQSRRSSCSCPFSE